MNQFRTMIAVAVLAALFAAPGLAQLTGTFTIDNTQPTAGSNYNNFIDAATDLTTLGISTAAPGDVTFVVSATATPYAGFSLGVVSGTSAANKVIFLGAPGGGPKPIITGPAAGFSQTVRFGTATSASTTTVGTGPSYVVFDGFEITGAPSGAAFLAIGCDFVTVRNCVGHTSGSGIGVSVSFNCTIEDCEVYGTTHAPGGGASTNYSGGIFAYYLSANNILQRNQIHDCADNGIFVGSSGSSTATPDNVVINNFVWECGTQSSATYAGGIALRRVTNSIVANNSVSMPAASLRAGIFVMTASTLAPMELSNNIVQHNGTAPCLQMDVAGYLGVLDFNLYDAVGGGPVCGVGSTSGSPTTPYATLAAWQAASGADANAVAGSASFLAVNDLHITPGSTAFNTGGVVVSLLGGVLVDIDGQARPIAGLFDIGADEHPATGIFAAFTATPTSGPAALTVNFTDGTFTSDPGGVTSWAWDFDNDGMMDSTLQNPSHTYVAPGSYSVSLTATDVMNGPSTHTKMGYITVGPYVFSATTTGAGDLAISPIPHVQVPSAVGGYMFVSLDSSLPVGAGAFFGLTPDLFTWAILPIPAGPNNILHWTYAPGLWPDIGLSLPAGTMSGFVGMSADFVQVDLDAGLTIANVSGVVRVNF